MAGSSLPEFLLTGLQHPVSCFLNKQRACQPLCGFWKEKKKSTKRTVLEFLCCELCKGINDKAPGSHLLAVPACLLYQLLVSLHSPFPTPEVINSPKSTLSKEDLKCELMSLAALPIISFCKTCHFRIWYTVRWANGLDSVRSSGEEARWEVLTFLHHSSWDAASLVFHISLGQGSSRLRR